MNHIFWIHFSRLMNAAQFQANYMASINQMTHNNPAGDVGQRLKKFAVPLDPCLYPEFLQRPPNLADGAAHHRLPQIILKRLNYRQRWPRRRGDQHRVAVCILSPHRSHMAKHCVGESIAFSSDVMPVSRDSIPSTSNPSAIRNALTNSL